MISFLILVPAFVVLCTASIMSYSRMAKSANWFLLAMPILGAINSLFWAMASRHAKSPNQLYVVGCIWDVLTLFSYTILPVMAGFIELNRMQWAGVLIMIAGVAIIKLGE